MICLTPKPTQSFFVYRTPSKENFLFTEKEIIKETGQWRIKRK